MTRVAAIDCGTNSTRLLVAEVDESGQLHDLVRDMRITRLGQGVDRNGVLSREALERTFAVASDYQTQILSFGVERIRVVSTSATRDARNRQEFVQGMQQILGVAPEVISGEEEAVLSFAGAISFLQERPQGNIRGTNGKSALNSRLCGQEQGAGQPLESSLGLLPNYLSEQRVEQIRQVRQVPEPQDEAYLVVDIGGGSTEFVRGTTRVQAAISTNLGSVRLTERFGPEPWDGVKKEKAVSWISEWLDSADDAVDFSRVTTLVGVAGTVTTIAAYGLGVKTYNPQVTHGARLSGKQWRQAMEFMVDAPVEKKAALGFMPAGRAEVIGGGTLIWREILERLSGNDLDSLNTATGLSVVVSEHDILDGIALSLANCL